MGEAMRRNERGFSMIKMMLIGAVIGGAAWAGMQVIPVYNAYWKVQDTFEGVVRNMSSDTEEKIRYKLPQLYKIKYLVRSDLPKEYYDNLVIQASGSRVTISSSYHVTVWLLGPVQDVNPDTDYSEDDLKGMDKVRNKLRLDFDFEPYAETP